MKTKKPTILTLEDFKNKYYGKPGKKSRDKLESDYENFKIGTLLLAARKEKGLTQEELADKVGTTKSYISRLENDIK